MPSEGRRDHDARLALRFTAWAAAVAVLGVLLVYAGAFDVGFYYDDYHLAHPWTWRELRRVWLWSWDPAGIEAKFFRPLTAWMFAGRFWLFGLNAPVVHALSVAGHVVCAVLVAWFLRREGADRRVAIFGAWLYAIHPAFPYAQVSWATNQMHLTASLLVLTALLYWQRARDRPLLSWGPLILWAAAAFFVKEDGIMLLPVLVLLTVLRDCLSGERRWKRCATIGTTGALVAIALVAFRQSQLGSLGGYGRPTIAMAEANFWKGLDQTLALWPTRAPWQAVASLCGVATLGVGLTAGRMKRRWLTRAGIAVAILLAFNLPALWYPRPYALVTAQGLASGAALSLILIGIGAAVWTADRRAIWLTLVGLSLACAFDLPFLLVSKREQYHLLTLGAVIAYAGSIEGLVRAAGRHARYVLMGCLIATLPFVVLARAQARDFLPCSPMVLEADAGLQGWPEVPQHIKTWLATNGKNCGTNVPIAPLVGSTPILWGVYEDTWTSDRATLMTSRQTASTVIAVRRSDATDQHPVHVTVTGGATPLDLTLTSGDWTYETVRFERSLLSWLRNAQRVDIDVIEWFVPALIDPKSSDLRRHGVELTIVK